MYRMKVSQETSNSILKNALLVCLAVQCTPGIRVQLEDGYERRRELLLAQMQGYLHALGPHILSKAWSHWYQA